MVHSHSPQPSDWYRVSQRDVLRRGGSGLFKYHASLGDALRAVYPEYEWQESSFPRTRGHWVDVNNLRHFLDSVAGELGVQQVSALAFHTG